MISRLFLAAIVAVFSAAPAATQPNTWTQKSDIGTDMVGAPYPRHGAAAFAIGNKGYVVVGNFTQLYNTSDLWEYDPSTDAWTQRTSFPGSARTDAVAFSIGNKGYVATGFDGTYRNDLWEYDPMTDSWTERTSMPGAGRCDAAAFVIGSKAYVTTGRNGTNMNDTWQYDPATDSWTGKAPFAGTARAFASAFSLGGLGYVGTGDDGTFRNDLWAYDPVADSWTAKANMPIVSREGIGFALGGKGYMGHGRSLSGSLWISIGSWYEYEPASNAWTQRSAYASRYSGFGFTINGRGYVGGGSNFGFNNPTGLWEKRFAEFDPATNSWATKARFGASVTMWAAACGLGGKGYVQQGGNAGGCARDSWEYDPMANNWTLLPGQGNASLTTGFGIGTKSYRATGSNNYTYLSSVATYDAGTGQSGSAAPFSGGARIRAAAFAIGGKAYLGTGVASGGNGYKRDLWEYDPVANAWSQRADLGGSARVNATAFSIGEKGYLGLGRDSSGLCNDLWAYDPGTNAWSACAPFPGAARSGASAFTIGTTAYVCCGGNGTVLFNDLWAYDAVTNTWAAKASLPGVAREGAASFAIDSVGYISAGAGASPSWLKDTWAYTGEAIVLRVSPKVFLEGAYVQAQTNMRDDLRANGLLPLVEPFTAAGGMVSIGPYAVTTSPVLAVSGMDAIVDFVLVELRDPVNPSNILASKAALVQRDGDVVSLDGVSPVSFIGNPGNYHVALRHRHHLGIMSGSSIALSATPTLFDFTNPSTATYGTNARKQIGNVMVMWAGDASGDGTLKYTGSNNDRDPILVSIGGTNPTNTLGNVYDRRDVNMDGVIKYTGANNDRDPILVNIGGTVPTNTRTQQLP